MSVSICRVTVCGPGYGLWMSVRITGAPGHHRVTGGHWLWGNATTATAMLLCCRAPFSVGDGPVVRPARLDSQGHASGAVDY